MAVAEALANVEDMLSLTGFQNENHLKNYFLAANKKTSIATDQIKHLIDSIDDRYARTASANLDGVFTKSLEELTRQVDVRLDFMIDTVAKLRRKLTSRREEIRRKMNAQDMLEKMIEKEYLMLRDKYTDMLRATYSEANEAMKAKELFHKESLVKYIQDLKDINDGYYGYDNDAPNRDRSESTSTVLSLRSTVPATPIPKKPICQLNNEIALLEIQEKLDKTFEAIIETSVSAYGKRIAEYPMKRLNEQRELFTWKQRMVAKIEADYIKSLSGSEKMYADLVDELTAELMRVTARYDDMYLYLRGLEERERANQIYVRTLRNKGSNKYTSGIPPLKLGSRVKELAIAAEMNLEDIENILLKLSSDIRL